MAQAKQNNVKDSRARILLVDDHAVVRFGIAQLINRQTDLVVCGEEEDASCAMNAINTLKPDLVIADISLKDSSGLELMRNIKAQYPRLPVLVVSVHDESIYAEIAFRAGSLGYLMKEEALEKIQKDARYCRGTAPEHQNHRILSRTNQAEAQFEKRGRTYPIRHLLGATGNPYVREVSGSQPHELNPKHPRRCLKALSPWCLLELGICSFLGFELWDLSAGCFAGLTPRPSHFLISD